MLKAKSDVEVLTLSSDQGTNDLVLSKNKPLMLIISYCFSFFLLLCFFFPFSGLILWVWNLELKLSNFLVSK